MGNSLRSTKIKLVSVSTHDLQSASFHSLPSSYTSSIQANDNSFIINYADDIAIGLSHSDNSTTTVLQFGRFDLSMCSKAHSSISTNAHMLFFLLCGNEHTNNVKSLADINVEDSTIVQQWAIKYLPITEGRDACWSDHVISILTQVRKLCLNRDLFLLACYHTSYISSII